MKYKSDILEVIHQSAIDKYEIGAISEVRMREYDEMCLAEENDTSKNSGIEKKQLNSARCTVLRSPAR